VRGRIPRLLEGWTAQRLVEAGAGSVKLLLYYSTLSSAGINEAKHEFVKRVGAECAEAEVNFCGVQCGGATWKDGVAVFVKHGVTTLDDWLHGEGARNMENVNKHLRAAQPWFSMNEELHSEKH